MKIRVGDNVKILTGKDKGKTGMVTKTLKKEDRVVVEGINVVKKHMKPNQMNQTGGIVEMNAPIHVSNVKKIDESTSKKESKKAKKD
ncbi:MAG: 50S ribosomal protein L24 [Bacilli bacterium]|jgi:large subunit ribosomal protein L24|nr:50S ribosomal protein L24 [Bacilli bacterium]